MISAGGKAETSDTAKVLILDRPEITSISENAVIDEGETIELIVEVSGQLPFSYQWKKSGSDSTISNFSSLTLKDVDESTSGQYYVIVSNAGGEAISPAINVVVRPDTDNDGLLDYVEIGIGTDITKSDTDGDGLGDFAEVRTYKTNPLSTDSDGDGLPDDVELREGFDPLVGTEAADGAFTVHTAIELEFFTLKSQQYIIQSSTDLENWEDETDKFQGKGGFYSIFASTREKQYSFWRLKVVE